MRASRKRYCLLSAHGELGPCDGNDHMHLSFRDVYGESGAANPTEGGPDSLLALGIVEFVKWPRVLRLKRQVDFRGGLSARLGELLAEQVRRERAAGEWGWGHLMMAEMAR